MRNTRKCTQMSSLGRLPSVMPDHCGLGRVTRPYADGVTSTLLTHAPMTRVSVASPLRLATEAGLEAARSGGNAIDAALTTAAVLTVAYPASCAIGGDLLALVREPDGRTTFIDASGSAPLATDVDAVRSRHREMPIHGPLPVTVPGMVGGWSALAAHGAALPWRDLVTPAQAAAAEGIAVSAGLAESIAETAPQLGPFPDLASVLCPGGSPLTQGQTLRQPALARTLGVLAEAGPSALYDGELTAAFCAGLAERGVPMTPADLRSLPRRRGCPLARGRLRVAGAGRTSQLTGVPRAATPRDAEHLRRRRR